MTQRLFQVDAFTDTPFHGNPAAVLLLPTARDAHWMQRVASEMNLSETAFLVPRQTPDGSPPNEFDLRWFTPAVEVDLCGHATLASAHTLWHELRVVEADEILFHTRSGVLCARRHEDGIELDFPALPPTAVEPPPGLLEALGLSHADYVGRSRFDNIVAVADEATVRTLRPDHRRLPAGTRGVMVTARADREFDFVSRFFAPGAGIDEDPVTGSAHSVLGPYWAERLGKTRLRAHQVSARGGVLEVNVRGDRVGLKGQSVTTLRAELVVPYREEPDRTC